MSEKKIPKSFIALIEKITNKRARIVIDHILKHGIITTEELEKDYGYNHPRELQGMLEKQEFH
jgi:hypothetical protein